MKTKFTAAEWDIILGAYAYEIESDPIMSDFTYDIFCKDLGKTTIPEFDPNTGMWIKSVLKVIPEIVIQQACAKARLLGEGTSPIHLLPKSYIKS